MHYRYCPLCGGMLEIKSTSLLDCTECGYHFYQNSNPTVNAAILRQTEGKKQVLLVRRGVEPFKGYWDLPGGFLKVGEDPEAGLKRELKEELGLSSIKPELFFTFVERYPKKELPEEAQFTLCLFYLIKTFEENTFSARDDITQAEWFNLDSLPQNLSFKGNRQALNALLR